MEQEPEVSFLFQFGNVRDVQRVSIETLTLKSLKEKAVGFINDKVRALTHHPQSPSTNYTVIIHAPSIVQLPENGLSQLANRLLLFRHDYNSPNVLQLVSAASEVIDETLIEIVLTANCE